MRLPLIFRFNGFLVATQVGRLVEAGLVELRTLPAAPVASFPARLVAAAAAEPFDVLFTSQTTYLLQARTPVPSLLHPSRHFGVSGRAEL